MNFVKYPQNLRTLLRCIPLTKSKFYLPNHTIPFISVFEGKQFESRSYLWTSNTLLAGHSKWANIKNTKARIDRQKNILTTKFAIRIRNACKEGGGTFDPVSNATLAKVITEAKRLQVPSSTIDRAIKNAQKSKENGKPGCLSYAASGGVLLLIDVHTDNMNRTRQQIHIIVRKMGLKEASRSSVEMSFEEKGVIVAQGDLDKALDHAIEVGAEDVTGEDESLTFVCDPKEFYNVKKGIEGLQYDIEYSDIDKIPLMQQSIDEADVEKYRNTLEKLEEHDDVVKVSSNVDV